MLPSTGRLGGLSDGDGTAGTIAVPVIDATQASGVSMWDITVRSIADPSAPIGGRVYTDYLAQITGGNGAANRVESTLWAVTNDGFEYRIDLRGLDPNGFILYGNTVGFLDPDGVTPLYHDLVADINPLSAIQGGVTLSPPTGLLFFAPPAADLPSSIVPSPVVPTVNSIVFQGTAGVVSGVPGSVVGTGGNIVFDGNIGGVAHVVIAPNPGGAGGCASADLRSVPAHESIARPRRGRRQPEPRVGRHGQQRHPHAGVVDGERWLGLLLQRHPSRGRVPLPAARRREQRPGRAVDHAAQPARRCLPVRELQHRVLRRPGLPDEQRRHGRHGRLRPARQQPTATRRHSATRASTRRRRPSEPTATTPAPASATRRAWISGRTSRARTSPGRWSSFPRVRRTCRSRRRTSATSRWAWTASTRWPSGMWGAASIGGLVTVTDTVPAGLNLVSAAGSGWACGDRGLDRDLHRHAGGRPGVRR